MQYSSHAAVRVAAPARRTTVTRLPVTRVKSGVKSKAGTKVSSLVLLAITVSVIFAGILSFNLFVRAQISDIKKDIIACDEILKSLESEAICLEMELENKISFENVESQAQSFGMVKTTDKQRKYIATLKEDKVQVITGENKSNSDD